jgi:hypothetical protein
MSTLTDLTAEITSQLPTGVSHEITAAKLRAVLTDMVSRITTDPTLLGGSGGGSSERYLTASTTASPGDICFCNTAAGGFTVTLPDNPAPGTGIGFRDAESSWAAANLTVFPGNNRIENTTGNLVCDVTNGNFDLVWSGAGAGWQVVPAIAFAGTTTSGGGAGVSYFHIAANQTVNVGGTYYCDTLGGGFTVTLPSGPAVGQGISFRDAAGTWGTANLSLNPGANPINSVVGVLAVDQSDINFDLVWRGSPIGWQVEIPVGKAARGTVGSVGLLTTKPLGALGQTLTAVRGGGVSWSPTDKDANIVLSNGNLTAAATASAASVGTSRGVVVTATDVRATVPGSAGRYFEVTWSASPNGFGVATTTQSLIQYSGNPNGIGFYKDGYVDWPGSGTGNSTGITFAAGDVMGLLLNSGNVQLFKNGALAYTVSVLPSGALYPILSLSSAGETATANFGATALAFLPAGATSWDGSRASSGSTVWNTADLSGVTLSNANLTATGTGTGGGQARGTKSAGAEHYFEAHIDAAATTDSVYVGVANASQVITSGFAGNPNGISYFKNGYVEWPGGSATVTGYAVGDVIGVRLQATAVRFYKNGTFITSTTAIPSGALFPIVGVYSTTCSVTGNFGASAFQSLPPGPVAWNT